MDELTVGRGERLDIRVDDTEAVSVTIIVSESADTDPIISKSATFEDGSAQITLLNEDTDKPEGDYVYQIRLFDDEGEYFNLDIEDCDGGDCSFSDFVICPALGEAGSS